MDRSPSVRRVAAVDFDTLLYAVEDRVCTITLNRPDRLNAYTLRMGADLLAAFDATDADDDVRAVVVTGAGRAFSAGADLEGSGAIFRNPGAAHRDPGGLVTLRIFESLKPVIAAINGAAVGFGITLTLPMDVRLVAEGAKIGFVFGRRGIVPEAASSWFLPRIAGISHALEWCYTGRLLTPAEALAGNLVRSVHAPDELLVAAHALAREIAEHSAPVSVSTTRQLMWRMLGAAHPMEAHRADSYAMADRGVSADAREGIAAFLDKRPATFADRVSAGLPLEKR
ncbi:MAG: hypothetical protein QOF76_5101 [Solirubrobacteraceae bacterium]|jgi:enoyl-CoA hydratase/carnithine racemase|nr:hypothetical protein [Solirubrobacteraceae bacterium]